MILCVNITSNENNRALSIQEIVQQSGIINLIPDIYSIYSIEDSELELLKSHK